MKPNVFPTLIAAAMVATVSACTSVGADTAEQSAEETKPPFSGPANVAYAADLWRALEEARLLGDNAFRAKPYEGQKPHGAVLVTMEGTLSLQGNSGLAIVKKNYVGDGVTVDKVANDPARYLASITVMYQREAGYDPDHDNWFWAKYKPDGSLEANPKGMKLAGRVAKGASQGCIACHEGAPGNDYLFTHDRMPGN